MKATKYMFVFVIVVVSLLVVNPNATGLVSDDNAMNCIAMPDKIKSGSSFIIKCDNIPSEYVGKPLFLIVENSAKPLFYRDSNMKQLADSRIFSDQFDSSAYELGLYKIKIYYHTDQINTLIFEKPDAFEVISISGDVEGGYQNRKIIEKAFEYIGRGYKSQCDIGELNCAIFVQQVYLDAGLQAPVTQDDPDTPVSEKDYAKTLCNDPIMKKIEWDAMQPGDIFVSGGSTEYGHTGIYIGKGFITGDNTKRESFIFSDTDGYIFIHSSPDYVRMNTWNELFGPDGSHSQTKGGTFAFEPYPCRSTKITYEPATIRCDGKQCDAPCMKGNDIGVCSLQQECVDVSSYIKEKMCCRDEDCSKNEVCTEGKCELKAKPIPVEKIANIESQEISPATLSKINILFVPDTSYKNRIQVFESDISTYMTYVMDLKPFNDDDKKNWEKLNLLKITTHFSERKEDENGMAYWTKDFIYKMEEYPQIDMIIIMHTGDLGDEEGHAFGIFAVVHNVNSFKHELGHLFGLSDEYDTKGLNEAGILPNVWKKEDACKRIADAVKVECVPITDTGTNEVFYKLDQDTIMSDSKVNDYGIMGINHIQWVLDNPNELKKVEKVSMAPVNTNLFRAEELKVDITKPIQDCTNTRRDVIVFNPKLKYCTDTNYGGCAICVKQYKPTLGFKDYGFFGMPATGICIASRQQQGYGMGCERNCQCKSDLVCDADKGICLVSGGLKFPTVSKRLVDCYGPGTLDGRVRFHSGIDIGASSQGVSGDSIYAASGGIVVEIKDTCRIESNINNMKPCDGINPLYGNYIIIEHTDIEGKKFYTLYGHLKYGTIIVKKDQKVNKAQEIGKMGSTGNSQNPHLHLTYATQASWEKQYSVNPCIYWNCAQSTGDKCTMFPLFRSQATIIATASDPQRLYTIDKIIKIAKENGVPPEIALAVADMESYGIHHFMPPDSDKVLVGGDGHGIGVMQIDDRSERTHIRCFKPPYDDPICQGPRCKGKTPYDLDCNIEAGIKFLKKNYVSGDDCLKNSVCGKMYCGWAAALRRYNGLLPDCNEPNSCYVEYVKARIQKSYARFGSGVSFISRGQKIGMAC
ncbi:MAG: peptidoglycan DD-metalloendopeptidase family protein [Candidatus Aenigmarchaeota archaeon]|nr:peptidoglycan DD-metalloendopeptidase family protein [Candidatus Aenigmarchaeota archaeon]